MRACVLTTVHVYDDNRILHKQIRTLLKAGYQVTYVAPCPPEVDRLEGIDLIPLPRLSRSRRPLNWRRALRAALASKADIFHFHDPELIVVGFLLRVLTRKPVVYDVHESYPEAMLDKGWIPAPLRSLVAGMTRALEWCAVRVCGGVIAANPPTYERFQRSARRVALIRNYVDLDAFDGATESASLAFEAPYFLYVGSISTSRGVSDCVAAFERLSRDGVELVLVGRIADSDASIVSLPGRLPARARWLGAQPFRHVPPLMRRSCAGLVTLHWTHNYALCIPTKLLEYMAASIPVIAYSLPLVRSIVEQAGCGVLVEPGNVEQLAAAMAYILDHPAEAAEMGRRGRQAVVERYSWETEAHAMLQFYAELLGRRSPAHADVPGL